MKVITGLAPFGIHGCTVSCVSAVRSGVIPNGDSLDPSSPWLHRCWPSALTRQGTQRNSLL
jgi:hypothetical protein